MSIDIRPRGGNSETSNAEPRTDSGKKIEFDYREKANSIEIFFDSDVAGSELEFVLDNEPILTTRMGQKSKLKFSKKSEIGRKIYAALKSGGSLSAFVR